MTLNLAICITVGVLYWGITLRMLVRTGGPWWSAMVWHASGFLLGSWIMFMLWWLR